MESDLTHGKASDETLSPANVETHLEFLKKKSFCKFSTPKYHTGAPAAENSTQVLSTDTGLSRQKARFAAVELNLESRISNFEFRNLKSCAGHRAAARSLLAIAAKLPNLSAAEHTQIPGDQ